MNLKHSVVGWIRLLLWGGFVASSSLKSLKRLLQKSVLQAHVYLKIKSFFGKSKKAKILKLTLCYHF